MILKFFSHWQENVIFYENTAMQEAFTKRERQCKLGVEITKPGNNNSLALGLVKKHSSTSRVTGLRFSSFPSWSSQRGLSDTGYQKQS